MKRKRVAAIISVALAAAVAVLAIIVAVEGFPHGLSVLACLLASLIAARYGVLRRGPARFVGLAIAALALLGAAGLVALEHRLVEDLVIVAGTIISLAAARVAFAVRARLPISPAPAHAVLFFNPLSGGGKARQFRLVDEARARGIEPIELRRGDNLASLVHDAVARGADALAMAGGDGSQAVVAGIAAELGLPYACVPAGTRNHFALDLGVDRDDVVGALDAFVDGGERRVDLAEVNGRVFVNNVSLGIYAEAVQRAGYRDAKLGTLLDVVPDTLGPDAERLDLRWRGSDGRERSGGVAILVSNNRYRLGRALGTGTRPRVDEGVLGITVLGAPPDDRRPLLRAPWREWSSASFRVDAGGPVAAGIDGEATILDPPLRFRICPGVLRVRIAHQHPGASPSAGAPSGLRDVIRSLARIGAGRDA